MRPIIRRRGMAGGDKLPADVIMTTTTNPEVLDICNAQGWCGSKYMTATEAAAVTDIGTAFQASKIKHFEEFEFFSGITSLPSNAFNGCTSLESIVIPANVQTIGYRAFYNCSKLDYHLVIPEGVTTIGDEAFRKARFRLVYVPSTTTIGSSVFRETTISGQNKLVVINRTTPPGTNSYTFAGSSPKWRLYVPVGATGNYPIRGSGLVYSAYFQSVNEIPSTFDTSSRQAIINSLDALDAIVGGGTNSL